MVKAIIDIDNDTNRILSIIKAEFGLKDKSQAIDVMAKEYEELIFEPKVKPSYLRRLKKIKKEKTIHIGTLKDFDKMFGTHE